MPSGTRCSRLTCDHCLRDAQDVQRPFVATPHSDCLHRHSAVKGSDTLAVRMVPRRSARRDHAREESDHGCREDVIAVAGDHVRGVGHMHVLGVRALAEEALHTGLTDNVRERSPHQ